MASNGLRPGTVRGSLRDSAPSTPTPVSTTQRSTLRSWEGSYGESAATQAPLSGASASPSLSLYSRPSCPPSVHSQASPTATGSPCRRHMLLHKSERSDLGSLPTVRATSTPLSVAPAQMSETVAITPSCVSRRQNRTPTGRASISSSPRLRPTPSSIPSPYSVTTCASTPGNATHRSLRGPAAIQQPSRRAGPSTLCGDRSQPPALRPSILGIRSAGAFATWAKLSANLGDDDIRLLGRWSSNAVRLYQESTPAQLADISRATLTVNPSAPTGILPPAACWWGDE